jgi:hypothetical protein
MRERDTFTTPTTEGKFEKEIYSTKINPQKILITRFTAHNYEESYFVYQNNPNQVMQVCANLYDGNAPKKPFFMLSKNQIKDKELCARKLRYFMGLSIEKKLNYLSKFRILSKSSDTPTPGVDVDTNRGA